MPDPQILAMGGYPDDALLEHALGLARGTRILYVPSAVSEDPDYTVLWYERLRGRGAMTHLSFFPWPPSNLRELTLAHDVVLASGGNTANAIAIWRAHGFDEILREAWQSGVLLMGWSAGMICWFEHGVTDSFGPQLAPMHCLGFLPGSACPHYDGEERRRPVYTQLVAAGFPAGIAADDDVGIHFVGTELDDVVTTRAGATAYRVTAEGETALEARPIEPAGTS
ncbi:MAG TPA: peptidase E [Gaiellaceae bacterium]|nr:peptidase E [Gaiellaceae bacterium]